MRKLIYTLILLALPVAMSAQIDRKEVRSGNRQFRRENYKEAEISYRKALVKDSLSFAANYNLASSHQIHIIGLIGIQGTENTRRLID